ncbi:MAG: PAS domain S-box protein, partial [Deltaproteobacteria bacterium]|nr:PAS domain S-box protein [Deltaproteobacteria bacterium]
VYSVLREGEITDANVAFCKIFGYTREETIGKNILELYSDPADRPKFQEQIEKSGFVKDYPVKFKRKDGKELDCLLTSSVHYGEDGRVVEYRGIMRDVTDQQLLQRQLLQAQKMEAIGTLAGGIAHDVNNLLQAVLGYSDLLLMKKGSSDPDAKKLKVIQQAARDGADLVTRILTFSRKGESKTRPIDLNEVIRKTEKLLRRTLPRMIEIDLALAADIRIIDADPSQVEQVILNLGVNAQHAMPNGGRLLLETSNVSVSDEYLRAHLGAKAGKYVLLTVSDTGIGIEPEVLDRIFEPFFTTKPSGVGTGLGLSMVHGIVTQHGGYIRCYSEQGQGTSFKIYFPVSKSELAFDPTLTRE